MIYPVPHAKPLRILSSGKLLSFSSLYRIWICRVVLNLDNDVLEDMVRKVPHLEAIRSIPGKDDAVS